MWVENRLDEVRVGVKGQSNSEIARTPRNAFRCSVGYKLYRGRATERNVMLVNNETMPYTSKVNLTLYKGFSILDNANLMLTFDIENLFDRRNVARINTYTGRPNQYGDYDQESQTKPIYEWYRTEWRIDPTNFAAGRQILFGLRLTWD